MAEGQDQAAILLRDGRQIIARGAVRARQPAFSITKMFVAVACLRSAARGLLDLDDDAGRWSPVVPPDLPLRQLLGHTSGLADYPSTRAYQMALAADPAKPWPLEEILAVTVAQPRSVRGTVRYSNAGYWMVGAVLERASGAALADVLAAEVFRPADMAHTAYPDASTSLTPDGYSTLWAGPAGAVWSTAHDLDKFLAALLGGTLLTASGLAAMQEATPIRPHPPWPAPGYGLGLMTDDVLHSIGHGGNGPGYQTAAFARCDRHRSAVVLAPASAPQDAVGHAVAWLTSGEDVNQETE